MTRNQSVKKWNRWKKFKNAEGRDVEAPEWIQLAASRQGATVLAAMEQDDRADDHHIYDEYNPKLHAFVV